jgi:uncharacterized protein YbjT (DUF2867 family)
MSKILVCGGTGFVGSNIVKKIACQHSVRVLTRDPNKIKEKVSNVEFVVGDLFNLSTLEKAMSGCDVVINAAQFDNAPFENPKKNQTYEKVDAEGTENIVQAAKKMNVTRILYISGSGVSEEKNEPWFRAKFRAERAVKNSGMAWTIFRPSWIYGPGDRSLNRMIPMIRYSPIVFIIGKGYQIQPVFVDDVAQMVAKSISEVKTEGQIYELGGPQRLTMKQILQIVGRVLHKQRLYISIPKMMARIGFSLAEKIPGTVVTKSALDFITMDIRIADYELKKAENDFQIQPSSLEKAIQTYL